MVFKVLGPITNIEIIAEGSGIRDLRILERKYGKGNWRKKKGIAFIETESGESGDAELHWYDCHGRGRFELKFKRYIDD